jgi:hypothetical protein
LRKETLKQEIHEIERGFGSRISGVKKGFDNTVRIKSNVQKSPLKSVAIAAGAGFLVGMLRRKKKIVHSGRIPGNTLTSILVRELKQIAAQKAMFYLSEFVDQQISSFQKSKKKSEDDF